MGKRQREKQERRERAEVMRNLEIYRQRGINVPDDMNHETAVVWLQVMSEYDTLLRTTLNEGGPEQAERLINEIKADEKLDLKKFDILGLFDNKRQAVIRMVKEKIKWAQDLTDKYIWTVQHAAKTNMRGEISLDAEALED